MFINFSKSILIKLISTGDILWNFNLNKDVSKTYESTHYEVFYF